MSDGNDVERHYHELQKQLVEDGFSPDSDIMKTTNRLAKALKEDGFSLSTSPPQIKTPVKVVEAKVVEAKAVSAIHASGRIHVNMGERAPLPQSPESIMANADRLQALPAAPSIEDSESESVVRAFRTKEQFDTDIITSVFSSIEGWRTKVIEHNGSHFVIVTNAKRLTDNRVKKALVAYVAERKQHGI